MPPARATRELRSPRTWLEPFHDVEFDAINEGGRRNRPGMRSASAQRLEVRFARSCHVIRRDGREGQQLDVVNLDQGRLHRIAAADLHLWPLPESNRDRDLTRGDVCSQRGAELHHTTLCGFSAPVGGDRSGASASRANACGRDRTRSLLGAALLDDRAVDRSRYDKVFVSSNWESVDRPAEYLAPTCQRVWRPGRAKWRHR